MKTLLTALILLACAVEAQAQTIETRKYGEATTLTFSLYDTTAANLKVDATDGGTDCSIIKDEGTETTCTNDFVDEGSTYSIALTASEMEAKRVMVCLVDGDATDAYLPKCLKVLTYGPTTSAQFPDAELKTAQSATSTSIQLASSESYADDLLNNNTSVQIVSGTGAGQTRCITDWVSSTDTATVATWTTTPDNTSMYTLLATPNCGQVSIDASSVWGYGTRTLTSGTLSAEEVWQYSTRAITDKTGFNASCSLGTDAITAASVSSGASNKIADHVLRRNTSNAESSSDGDSISRKSLLGATAQQTHKVSIVGDTMTTYRSDGTTILGTRTVTSSSSAAPITGVGN